ELVVVSERAVVDAADALGPLFRALNGLLDVELADGVGEEAGRDLQSLVHPLEDLGVHVGADAGAAEPPNGVVDPVVLELGDLQHDGRWANHSGLRLTAVVGDDSVEQIAVLAPENLPLLRADRDRYFLAPEAVGGERVH